MTSHDELTVAGQLPESTAVSICCRLGPADVRLEAGTTALSGTGAAVVAHRSTTSHRGPPGAPDQETR